MLSGRATYKATAPAPPPMDLDSGRPNARDALMAGGVTVAFWAAAAAGGWIAALFGPHGFETLSDIGIARWIGFGFGILVGFAGLALGIDFARLTRRAWLSYERRKEEWQEAALVAWEAQRGQVVEETSNEWELRASKPDEVLWFIVAMHQAVLKGEETPWVLRSITDEGVWVGSRKLAINSNQARLMVDNLATMGLIRNRTERHAGQWAPKSLDQAVEIFERNSNRVL